VGGKGLTFGFYEVCFITMFKTRQRLLCTYSSSSSQDSNKKLDFSHPSRKRTSSTHGTTHSESKTHTPSEEGSNRGHYGDCTTPTEPRGRPRARLQTVALFLRRSWAPPGQHLPPPTPAPHPRART